MLPDPDWNALCHVSCSALLGGQILEFQPDTCKVESSKRIQSPIEEWWEGATQPADTSCSKQRFSELPIHK